MEDAATSSSSSLTGIPYKHSHPVYEFARRYTNKGKIYIFKDILTFTNETEGDEEDWSTFRNRVLSNYPSLRAAKNTARGDDDTNMWDVDLVQYVSPYRVAGPCGSSDGRLSSVIRMVNCPYKNNAKLFNKKKNELVVLVAHMGDDNETIVRFSLLLIVCDKHDSNREVFLFDPRTNDSRRGYWQNSYNNLKLEIEFGTKMDLEWGNMIVINPRIRDDQLYDDGGGGRHVSPALHSLRKCIDFVKTPLDKGHSYITYSPVEYERNILGMEEDAAEFVHDEKNEPDPYGYTLFPLLTWKDLVLTDTGRYKRQTHIQSNILITILGVSLEDFEDFMKLLYK